MMSVGARGEAGERRPDEVLGVTPLPETPRRDPETENANPILDALPGKLVSLAEGDENDLVPRGEEAPRLLENAMIVPERVEEVHRDLHRGHDTNSRRLAPGRES